MKRYLLLLLLAANLQPAVRDKGIELRVSSTVTAQHMYREASDNCLRNNMWYRVSGVCDAPGGESPLRCEYCGLYYPSTSARNTHQQSCSYAPQIEYEYDNSGNRTRRDTKYYRWGKRTTALNESSPLSSPSGYRSSLSPVAIIQRRKESSSEVQPEDIV